ncbi:hypothetical protein CV102_25225 [Natronococcus pandeyae]|uniref:DUF7847 domain-containing protein n=1 Tax=Natronococcus pandeyae TaxID=2055836 RepID=A0A8J8TMS9_9EURY|nr:hypothetical protein CV102_25225 [Natronococcus pandeyae]
MLADGIERTLARNGLLLVLAFFVIAAVQTLFTPVGSELEPNASPIVGGPAIGWLVATVASLLGLYLTIVALRTFVTDERDTIPDAALRDRPVWTFLNVLVGYIVFTIVVAVGLVLLIVPGLFLLVALWFFDVYVAVEDDDFVTGMQRSWSLTSGHRLSLFGLGVAVILIIAAISVPFSILEAIVGGVLGSLIAQLGGAFTAVYIYATTAVAFTQLRDPVVGAETQSETTDDWGSSTDDYRSH